MRMQVTSGSAVATAYCRFVAMVWGTRESCVQTCVWAPNVWKLMLMAMFCVVPRQLSESISCAPKSLSTYHTHTHTPNTFGVCPREIQRPRKGTFAYGWCVYAGCTNSLVAMSCTQSQRECDGALISRSTRSAGSMRVGHFWDGWWINMNIPGLSNHRTSLDLRARREWLTGLLGLVLKLSQTLQNFRKRNRFI